jgi:hypothetical protein
MPTKPGKEGMATCMKEWRAGSLHSGKGGPVVQSQAQAVAICLNKSGQSKAPAKGKK